MPLVENTPFVENTLGVENIPVAEPLSGDHGAHFPPAFRRGAAAQRRLPSAFALSAALSLGVVASALSVAAPPAAAQTAAIAAPSAGGTQGCDPGETLMRFSHVTSPTGSPKGVAADRLAQLINERLNGSLCMEVYPDSTLFNDNEVMDALLRGDVELAAPAISKIDTIAAPFLIFSLPFIFRDTDALQWFQNSGPGVRMRRELNDAGFVGLSYWNNGMRQMSATRPLMTPSDAAGLTFRVSGSDAQVQTYRALGADAVKMSFSKVYDALANGDVEGQENTWPNIKTKRFFEQQDGITETNHSVSLYVLVTSEQFWRSVPVELRGELNSIIAEVSAGQNLAVQDRVRESRDALRDAGVEIRRLNTEERQAWIEALRPVWNEFEDLIGSDYMNAAVSANR